MKIKKHTAFLIALPSGSDHKGQAVPAIDVIKCECAALENLCENSNEIEVIIDGVSKNFLAREFGESLGFTFDDKNFAVKYE